MGKHRQGGQSAQRFERLIEEAAHNFFKRATEHASSYWLPHLENIQAVIIGGPGATKDFVVKNEYFHHEIAKKIAKTTFDVGYSNESGVRELVENAGQLMGEIELDAERQVMNRFLEELIRAHPKATYEMMIKQALSSGAVDTSLISEGLRGTSSPCSAKVRSRKREQLGGSSHSATRASSMSVLWCVRRLHQGTLKPFHYRFANLSCRGR